MRILAVCLTLFLLVFPGKAQGNLCDANWFETATAAQVRAFVEAGVDVNQICTLIRNQPLHQALLADNVAPGVIRALVEAGADAVARNSEGHTPLDYAEERLDRAMSKNPRGSAAYRREEMIYTAVNRYFESDRATAVSDAHAKLCDLDWWRSSASGPAVKELLAIPGVDPNTVCNRSNDRPIHLPLKLTSFVMLTENTMRGIEALVEGQADLLARNASGRSPEDLAELRYDRVRDRVIQYGGRWCNRRVSGQEFVEEIARNRFDTAAHSYVAAAATGQSLEQVSERKMMELYRTQPEGELTREVFCRYWQHPVR